MEVEEVFARFRAIKAGIRAGSGRPVSAFGEHRSGFQGSGYDIVGVERWRPGEPVKDMAWHLSLRTYPDKLFKIERMEPKQIRTLLVVDLSHSTLFEISQRVEQGAAAARLDRRDRTDARQHARSGGLARRSRIGSSCTSKPKLGSSHVFHIAHEIFDRLRHERQYPSKRRAALRCRSRSRPA